MYCILHAFIHRDRDKPRGSTLLPWQEELPLTARSPEQDQADYVNEEFEGAPLKMLSERPDTPSAPTLKWPRVLNRHVSSGRVRDGPSV